MLAVLKEGGLELAGTVPADPVVYDYDLNGRPTVDMPEESASVEAAFNIFNKVVA
jgi:CO dehydrogenase maturation factor